MKGKEIMVSVLMITYNHGKYIEEVIRGILMQQVDFAVELLICNDASTDNTNKLIECCILNNSSQITITYNHHKQNIGMMANFIFGLEHCQGKYIALCEGDDYWTDPSKLQKQVEFLESSNNLVACFSDAIYLNECNQSSGDALLCEFKKEATIAEIGQFWIPTLTVMFHTEALKKIYTKKYFAKVKNGDMFLYYLISQYGNFGYVKTLPSVYRQHSGGVWSSLKVLDKYKQNLYSNFVIYDSLNRINRKYVLIRINDNITWHLNYFKSNEHISILLLFYAQNALRFLNRFLFIDFLKLTINVFPVFLLRINKGF